MSFRSRAAGMIGNILGNYDKSLFGLVAPFIAPLFFGPEDPVTALILTYAMLPLGFVTKPLGSLFFGRIGDRYGRKFALCCSLVGIAATTLGMGCLPVYKTIGAWAPLWLALARMLQSFFAAGESTGAALYLLENTAPGRRSLISGFYAASSIVGYVIASGLVVCFSGYMEEGWRVLFWIGSVTAIFGVALRLKNREDAIRPGPVQRLPVVQVLREHRDSTPDHRYGFIAGLWLFGPSLWKRASDVHRSLLVCRTCHPVVLFSRRRLFRDGHCDPFNFGDSRSSFCSALSCVGLGKGCSGASIYDSLFRKCAGIAADRRAGFCRLSLVLSADRMGMGARPLFGRYWGCCLLRDQEARQSGCLSITVAYILLCRSRFFFFGFECF
jgi:MFS family permease